MFRTSLQTLWKHGQRVLKNVARTEVRQQPRLVEQELVQSVDTTPLTWTVFRSVAKELRSGLSKTVFSQIREPEFLTSTSRGLRGRLPLLSLVAGGLVIRSQMDEADLPSDSMLAVIKTMWKTCEQSSVIVSTSLNKKSSDFAFSELIGRGCNSAVYSAWEKADVTDPVSPKDVEEVVPESEDSETSSIISEDSTTSEYSTVSSEWSLIDVSGESSEELMVDVELSSSDGSSSSFESDEMASDAAADGRSEVAVKIIFNYRAASNEQQILREFTSELVPSSVELADVLSEHWQNGHRSKMKHLPPHPNIVSIQSAFVDIWPHGLPDTHQFPLALPHYLCEDGCGRNQTLFLVMDRYPCTLDVWLKTHTLTSVDKAMVVLQLVEALAHMCTHQVSHRDLKLDNVLCREEEGSALAVALSDFGSCVAGDLVLPYVTDQTAKGGNWAHMAPEIAHAQPGVYSKLDYRKADIWSVGLMACEIFAAGRERSFTDWLKQVANEKPEHIDSLPMFDCDELSRCVGKLVKSMLSSNPAKRPDARVLSNILHVWLWGRSEWRRGAAGISATDVRAWIVQRAAHDFVRCHRGHESSVSAAMKAAFFAGLTAPNIRATIDWLRAL